MTYQEESAQLLQKERGDAKRKAETRGIPFYILRGQVYRCDKDEFLRSAQTFEKMLWDALPDIG